MRMYANNTITVSGANLTAIQIVFAKQGTKAYASLAVSEGNLVSGGESTSAEDLKTDSWTGNASSVVFTLGASGQRLIAQLGCRVSIGSQRPQDVRIVLDGSRQLRAQPEAESQGKQASAHGSHRGNESPVKAYQDTQSQDRQDHNVHNVHLISFPPAGFIILRYESIHNSSFFIFHSSFAAY